MAVLTDDVFFNPGDFSRRVTVADLKDTISGGSGSVVIWDDVTGKPAVIAAGADQAAARTAIGAGTSNLALGTTASTAKAGNYSPPNATASVKGLVSQGVAVADATEDTLVAQFNALLASLRTAGVIAA